MLSLASCEKRVEVTGYSNELPSLTPDYTDVTIPYNLAPLCFTVEGEGRAALIVAGARDSICLTSDDGSFNIPQRAWRRLMEQERGRELRVTVCHVGEQGWIALKPFGINVSMDAIDPYLVYRRIPPGYGLWNRMGIYQRCLENYEETSLYENRYGRGNCANCHSFCEGDADRWQIHIRARYGGTYVMDGRKQRKLNLKDKSHGNPVYANWHPNGQLVAYSTNKTFFLIHTTHKNRWEVMDEHSDVMVVDVASGESYRSPLTAAEGSFETFPCFSPDGRWLYFCTAEMREQVVEAFDSIRYSICRIAFDADSRCFGERVDTVYNARCEGGSASFPRISPDGRWLCFTRSAYGNFSICHRDADLCMIDLQNALTDAEGRMTFRTETLVEANSPQVDSYHSWSRNSRWLVFSSKREDAIYTKLYFTHVDEEGHATKAFVLPQLDAKNAYDLQMDCYNIPELVDGKVKIDNIELDKTPQKQTAQEQSAVN